MNHPQVITMFMGEISPFPKWYGLALPLLKKYATPLWILWLSDPNLDLKTLNHCTYFTQNWIFLVPNLVFRSIY